MAFDPLNPNERTALGLTVDPVEDPKANELLEFLSRAHRQAAVTAGEDPLAVAERAYKEINPARRFMADFFRGMQANMNGQPATTVRESLFEQAITRQQLAQKQAESNLQRITQLMTQEAISQRQEQRLDVQQQQFGLKYGLDVAKFDQNDRQWVAKMGEKSRQFDTETLLKERDLERQENTQTYIKERDELDRKLDERRLKQADEIIKIREKQAANAGKKAPFFVAQPQTKEGMDIVKSGFAMADSGPKGQLYTTLFSMYAQDWEEAVASGDPRQIENVNRNIRATVSNRYKDTLSAEERGRVDFRSGVLRDVERVEALLDRLPSTENLGLGTMTLEGWARRFGKDNPTITAINEILKSSFFEFRVDFTGAAFSVEESADYESIRPSISQTMTQLRSQLQRLKRYAVEDYTRSLGGFSPEMLQHFIDVDQEGNKGIIIDGRWFGDDPDDRWFGDIAVSYGY